VTTAYTIKDTASRSGFSTSTLRYYEEIGLLPEANRTPAGYRLYDEGSLERLAFIARAKQLGCSLDEIADLSKAWEAGRCGPVQDRLRTVVAEKVASAQCQIEALTTLVADLSSAATALAAHRPDGPCDDACGCVTDGAAADAPHAEAVPLVSGRGVRGGVAPIACTLGSDAMQRRVEEWEQLLDHVVEREPVDGGLRATFGTDAPIGELIRLVAAEQTCCQFFTFAITVDSRGIALEVRGPGDALPLVDSLFGDRSVGSRA
jgi:DNA-binding transcriptional MerR regulator